MDDEAGGNLWAKGDGVLEVETREGVFEDAHVADLVHVEDGGAGVVESVEALVWVDGDGEVFGAGGLPDGLKALDVWILECGFDFDAVEAQGDAAFDEAFGVFGCDASHPVVGGDGVSPATAPELTEAYAAAARGEIQEGHFKGGLKGVPQAHAEICVWAGEG